MNERLVVVQACRVADSKWIPRAVLGMTGGGAWDDGGWDEPISVIQSEAKDPVGVG